MKTPLLLCSLAILAQVPIKEVTGTTSTVLPTMVEDTTLSTTTSNTDATTTTKVAPTTDTQTSAATNNITTSTATATTVAASNSTSEAKPVSTTTKSSTGTSTAEPTTGNSLATDSTRSSSDSNIPVTSAITTNNASSTAPVENMSSVTSIAGETSDNFLATDFTKPSSDSNIPVTSAVTTNDTSSTAPVANMSSTAVATGGLPTADIPSTTSDTVGTTQTSRISPTDSRNVVMTSVPTSTTAAVITPGDTSTAYVDPTTSAIVVNPQTSGKTTDNIQPTDSTGKATDNMQTTDSARSSSDSDTTDINVVTTTTAATKDNTSTTGAIGNMSTVDIDSNSTTSDVIGVSQTTPKIAEPSTVASTQTPLRTTHVATRPTTTPPPVTRIPPTEKRIISLKFEIVYQSRNSKKRSSFDAMPVIMADDPSQKLQNNLTGLYSNNTSGFSSLEVTSMPNETFATATYEVAYWSADLTSDCRSTSGCKLVGQIQQNVMPFIPEYGQLPDRSVDINATENAMNHTLETESRRLGNPCLMNKHVCANPDHTDTCSFNATTKEYWCVNVCRLMPPFCHRGTCTAYDKDNNGYNGNRTCSCPPDLQLNLERDDCLDVPTTCGPFEYLDKDRKCKRTCERFHFLSSNDQCVSWWAVLGPLIGVTVIALLSVLAVVVLIRRKPPKEKGHGLGESYTDDRRYTSVPTRVSAQDSPYQFDNNAHEPLESFAAPEDTTSTAKQEEKEPVTYEDVNEKLLPKETPTPLKEQDLQDFASLTNAEDLAQHPKLRDFSPQLDRVDTSKQYKIPRIGGSTRPYEENLSSAIPRTSMHQYSNPTYQNEEAVIRL